MNIITWLRTPTATLIVLCSALLAQLPHAADVFRLVVMGDGWGPTLHSYTYAVALELAVLLFVVQRRNVESYLFAGVSILVNLSYYHLHGVMLWSVAAAPAWLISIALPAAIAQYSHLIAAATANAAATDKRASTPARTWWRVWWRKTDNDAPPVDVAQPEPSTGDAPAPQQVTPTTTLSNTELARILNVSRQTVSKWRAGGALDAKIAARLPELSTAPVNGKEHTYHG